MSKLIARGGTVGTFLVSPDGRQIAYSSPTRFERAGSQQILFDLHTVDLLSGSSKTVASDIRLNISGADFRWSPDGSWIAFVAAGMEEDRSDGFAIDLKSRTLSNLTTFDAQIGPNWGSLPLWDKAAHFYFLRSGELWRAAIGQSRAKPVSSNHAVHIKQMIAEQSDLIWSPDGGESTIVLAHDTVTEHDGFYKINLKTGAIVPLSESAHCYTCVVRRDSFWVSPNGRSLAFIRRMQEHPPISGSAIQQ